MSRRVSRGDLLAVLFLAVLAFCYLAPALKDGPSFGPADIAQGLSYLTRLPGPPHHNHDLINGDQITQSIPWNTLDWRLVHHGELPLWNGLSGTGMPQLLNFESAPFALPSLVGYLFPLSLAFLVTIGIKLLIAGTGVYVCCRLLGCRPLSAALGGASAMLSGNVAGWLGWPVSGTLVWTGWLLAGCLCCYRAGRHRSRRGAGRGDRAGRDHAGGDRIPRGAGAVALLALSSAFAVYGGFPEGYVLVAFGLGVVLVVTAAVALAQRRGVSAAGVGWIGLGLLGGAALSSPLWLAGLPVLRASARAGKQAATGLPLKDAVLLFAQGFYGLPIRGSYFFGPVNYFETAAYLGVVAIVCGLVAVVAHWRRPVVVGLAVGVLACFLLIYRLGSGGPVQRLVTDVGLGDVALQRGLSVLALLVAVLAGLGAEAVLASWRRLQVRAGFLAASAAVGIVLVICWIESGAVSMPAADAASYHVQPTTAVLASLRRASLLWPTAEVAAMLVGGAVASRLALVRWRPRHGAHVRPEAAEARLARWAVALGGGGLLAVQSGFLLFAGVGINSYAATSYPETPAVSALQSLVGGQLVGIDAGNASCAPPALTPPQCGVRRWNGIGLYPDVNLAYGLDELAMHDPTIPQSYFDAWPVPDADQQFDGNFNVFVPDVDTLALARRYGVAYVLAADGERAPAGMTKVASIASNDGDLHQTMTLYAVPGASRFSFLGSPAGDRVVSASHPGDASYRLRLAVDSPATLFLRITDVPGWRASADGRSLVVKSYDGMLAVQVPAGTTSLDLRYWPARLTIGFVAALVALVALVGCAAAEIVLRRRGSRSRELRQAGISWRLRSGGSGSRRGTRRGPPPPVRTSPESPPG